jgi:hypothetical protein
MQSDTTYEANVIELDEASGSALFDRIVRREMGISGAEFLDRWDAGEWVDADYDAVPGLIEARNALPFARAL